MEEARRSIAPPETTSPATRENTSHPQGHGEAPAPVRERRKPRISDTPPAAPPAPQLADYEPIIGKSQLDELRFVASPLRGKRVKMVNSTAVGGGVAEMLNRLVPLLDELEIKTGWEVITGGNDFFEVTKAFHNALHGGDFTLTQQARDVFMLHNEQNRQRMNFDEDFVVIHDPQPAGLIASKAGGHWIWRCHIDLSHPNRDVWSFLQPMVERYDAAVFSSPAFARSLAIPQALFYPCIDPLSEKNKDLEDGYIQEVCDNFGVDRSRPIVTQISRFDRLKDPLGVIHAYKMAKKYMDFQLVLAGGGASDDPEGAVVLKEVQEAAGEDPDIIILELPPWSALEINALQRASTIIVQKSLKEGFGLTVTEGLWKGKPTIASAVGGIPTQVIDKHTGVLVHSVEGCAYQIRYLLTHPEFGVQLGRNGREHVKENFLMTTNARRWVMLFRILSGTNS
ncbi:MAG: glycosyltransferase [Terriglobales bacterium]